MTEPQTLQGEPRVMKLREERIERAVEAFKRSHARSGSADADYAAWIALAESLTESEKIEVNARTKDV